MRGDGRLGRELNRRTAPGTGCSLGSAMGGEPTIRDGLPNDGLSRR